MFKAAATLDVLTGRIAKTLSLRVGDAVVLVVAAGDYRLDNRKVKDVLGSRPRMLAPRRGMQPRRGIEFR